MEGLAGRSCMATVIAAGQIVGTVIFLIEYCAGCSNTTWVLFLTSLVHLWKVQSQSCSEMYSSVFKSSIGFGRYVLFLRPHLPGSLSITYFPRATLIIGTPGTLRIRRLRSLSFVATM